jgi:arylsulfatase
LNYPLSFLSFRYRIEASNYVLVAADSLRGDRCGHLNSESDLTPTSDELAEDGIAFENAIAPGPSTYECMPSVWTGE